MMARPVIIKKFSMFPMPKYLSIKKKIRPDEAIKPLLELPNIIEKR